MDVSSSSSRPAPLILRPVDHDNWEDVARLTVNPEQASFVAEPTNVAARRVYHSLGFRETGEVDDTEVIARLDYDAPQQ